MFSRQGGCGLSSGWLCSLIRVVVFSHQGGCVLSSGWLRSFVRVVVFFCQGGCVLLSGWLCSLIRVVVFCDQGGCGLLSGWLCFVIRVVVFCHQGGCGLLSGWLWSLISVVVFSHQVSKQVDVLRPVNQCSSIRAILSLGGSAICNYADMAPFTLCHFPFIFSLPLSLSPEIPLFHVLNARVTFGNIFGSVTPQEFVTLIREPTMSCVVDEQCFEAPATYHQSGKG